MKEADWQTRLVVYAYTLLVSVSLIGWLVQVHDHPWAWFWTVVRVILLVALVVRRRRLVWFVTAFAGSIYFVEWVARFSHPWWFAQFVVVLALLFSPQMRHYVRPPIVFRKRQLASIS